jgi:hypothetical protein
LLERQRALAEKSDELMLRHLPLQHDVTAVVAMDVDQASSTTGKDDSTAGKEAAEEEVAEKASISRKS